MKIRSARRLFSAGAILALLVLSVVPAVPVHAVSDWKDAVAQINTIRDQAIDSLLELGSEFESFLSTGPTVDEANEQLGETHDLMGQVADEALASIRKIMEEFPESTQVQVKGELATGFVVAAESFSKAEATRQYNEYVDGLSDPPTSTTTTSTTTTTTLPPSTTTSTTVPPTSTTTTSAPPSTTSTTRPPVTTTTTTRPPPSTTSTTRPPATTTTVVTATPTTTTTSINAVPATTTTTIAGLSDVGAAPPGSGLIDSGSGEAGSGSTPVGDIGERSQPEGPSPNHVDSEFIREVGSSSTAFADERGITASLTRALEPVLPTPVADVVVSPLLILELLWRAISSSGQGLVAPISLLVFSVASLLWDWRRSRRLPPAIPA